MKLSVNGRKDVLSVLQKRFLGCIPSWKEILLYAEECFHENMEHKNVVEGSNRYFLRKVTIYERAFRDIHLYCKAHNLDSPFGYVYVVSNPAWDELKLGSSIDAESRLLQYNTYSPKRDYKLEYYILIPDYMSVEQQLHKDLNAVNEWVNLPLAELKLELKRIKQKIYWAIV